MKGGEAGSTEGEWRRQSGVKWGRGQKDKGRAGSMEDDDEQKSIGT